MSEKRHAITHARARIKRLPTHMIDRRDEEMRGQEAQLAKFKGDELRKLETRCFLDHDLACWSGVTVPAFRINHRGRTTARLIQVAAQARVITSTRLASHREMVSSPIGCVIGRADVPLNRSYISLVRGRCKRKFRNCGYVYGKSLRWCVGGASEIVYREGTITRTLQQNARFERSVDPPRVFESSSMISWYRIIALSRRFAWSSDRWTIDEN